MTKLPTNPKETSSKLVDNMQALEKLLIELWQTQKLFAEHIEGRMVLHPEAVEKIKEMG